MHLNVMGIKRTKQKDFQTTWMKVVLVLNPNQKIRKAKAKTWCVHDVKAKRFYYKNMTITKQDYDKICLKLVLKKLKVMWDFTSIYIHWVSSSKKLLKNFSIYMWPMFIYVWLMCTHVWPMSIHDEN
jgi:hypothetical protein